MGPGELLRQSLLRLSASDAVAHTIESAPVSRSVVKRYVAGTSPDDAVDAVATLRQTNRFATVDYLGEDTTDQAQARHTADAYVTLLRLLADQQLSQEGKGEVSLKLTALGLELTDGHAVALYHARRICQAAANAGTTVTLDMEDHTTTDATLEILNNLRQDFPWVGVAIQAYLHRSEADCLDLATAGSRVRLCKGAYAQPESVAYQHKHDVDLSYVRCLKTLMAGRGYPMIASHDPRVIEITAALAAHHERSADSFEFQMLFGIRADEQRRLADRGHQLRVYVPYGDQWYGYLMRRMAERPANTMFFVRSLLTNG